MKPFKLKAIVGIPKAVNQIQTTGQAAKKKCNELLGPPKGHDVNMHVYMSYTRFSVCDCA